MLPANPLDAFGGENLAERETFAAQKNIDHAPKTAADARRRLSYFQCHEKTLLGFSPEVNQGGLFISPRIGQKHKTNRWLPDRKKFQPGAQGHSTRRFQHDSAIRA